MTRRARDTNQDTQGMKSRTDCSGEKTSGALQCPQVLITPGLPARDDFQKTTNVVHGCICSLLRTWEAKQYSSTMRETDSSLIAARRKMAGQNTVPHFLPFRDRWGGRHQAQMPRCQWTCPCHPRPAALRCCSPQLMREAG